MLWGMNAVNRVRFPATLSRPIFSFLPSSTSSTIAAGRRATEVTMFRFVSSLFCCSHKHCSFPITTSDSQHSGLADSVLSTKTYVVCLDCGKEFPYDWKQMKIVKPGNERTAVA